PPGLGEGRIAGAGLVGIGGPLGRGGDFASPSSMRRLGREPPTVLPIFLDVMFGAPRGLRPRTPLPTSRQPWVDPLRRHHAAPTRPGLDQVGAFFLADRWPH